MSRRLFLPALALLACSVSARTAPQARKPVAHTVIIEEMQFTPATLEVHPGDSVTWVNKDIVEHTATAAAPAKQPFDSRSIAAGKSWKRTFTNEGRYAYVCTYHPTMKGAVEVTSARPARRTPRA